MSTTRLAHTCYLRVYLSQTIKGFPQNFHRRPADCCSIIQTRFSKRRVSLDSKRSSFMTSSIQGGTDGKLEVAEEDVVYKRYLTVLNRTVRFPANSEGEQASVDFDVVGHPRSQFQFSVVFPFHTKPDGRHEVTVLKEYCQGPNAMCYCLPTGGFDPNKHLSMADCAAAELSEEAKLKGGTLIRLIPENHAGIPEVKWSLNRFVPYLVLDPEVDTSPGPRDPEEIIEITRVGIQELKRIMFSGDMQTPSIVTCSAALEHLEKNKLM